MYPEQKYAQLEQQHLMVGTSTSASNPMFRLSKKLLQFTEWEFSKDLCGKITKLFMTPWSQEKASGLLPTGLTWSIVNIWSLISTMLSMDPLCWITWNVIKSRFPKEFGLLTVWNSWQSVRISFSKLDKVDKIYFFRNSFQIFRRSEVT